MKIRNLIGGLSIVLVASAAPESTFAASKKQLARQLAPYIQNHSVLEFLVDEAKKAKVSRYRILSGKAYVRVCPANSYGCAPMREKRKGNRVISRTGEVVLNADMPGGTSVINITHETAHVGAFTSKGCSSHGEAWLSYLMGIAERYETRFPGYKWGRNTPVDSVKAKYVRYAAQRKSC